jgi:glycine/D-amino acid oxidase-like deaminating enzyme
VKKDTKENVKKRIVRRYEGLKLLKQTLGEKEIGYEHCGGYEFFRSQKAFRKVAPEIERFNGWMQELIGEDKVYSAQELEGYPVIQNRLEGALHPGKMMQQLVQRVNEAGVEIKWNSAVEQLTREGRIHITNGPVLKSAQVLIAANGFVRRLLPDLDITPARGFVLVTNEQDVLPWKGIFHHDQGYIYFRNIGNRLLIGGARNLDKEGEETDSFGTNKKIKDYLVQFTSEVLHLEDGWNIEQEWSGIMGFTPTKTPVIEQVDDRLFVAAGLSGMGIAIGMEVGQSAAQMIKSS